MLCSGCNTAGQEDSGTAARASDGACLLTSNLPGCVVEMRAQLFYSHAVCHSDQGVLPSALLCSAVLCFAVICCAMLCPPCYALNCQRLFCCCCVLFNQSLPSTQLSSCRTVTMHATCWQPAIPPDSNKGCSLWGERTQAEHALLHGYSIIF